jgi:oligopeptidase B
MNDRESPEVLAHIEAENRYTAARLAGTQELQKEIFREVRGRIRQDDSTVPVKIRDYHYYMRTEDGRPYPIHCRKAELDAPEEVLLDVNQLAEGHSFCQVAQIAVRPDQQVLAASIDYVGRRQYVARFKDLRTGEWLDEEIPDIAGSLIWAEDDRTLFYVKKDPQTLRPDRVYRHRLGSDPTDDELVFQEEDETYHVGLTKSISRRYLFIYSEHTLRTEARMLRSDDPTGDFEVFLAREGEHEYDVDHLGDHFYIRSNDDARNFRIFRCPETNRRRESWAEIVPHRDEVFLDGFCLFDEFLVTEERESGLVRFCVRDHQGVEHYRIPFDDPAYAAWLGANPEPSNPRLRYHYSSMGVPHSVYDCDLRTQERTLRKRDEIGGGFDAANYVTERLWAEARDGVRVPISLVRRRDTAVDGSAPLLQVGYGSYGISVDPAFSAARISLLDRGFVVAIAHVRGGGELGRSWYEGGKKMTKWNTFHDFEDCTEFLVREGYGAAGRIFASGGSAGGLLMGAVMNDRPDLYAAVVAQVPFVDVVTTMLDESIPLTTGEYDEWGNPHDPEFFRMMLSYSPYDQVKAQDYPDLLAKTGFHDSQVQYWEPAKWVARLRDRATNDAEFLLKTNMDAGHGGASDRYEGYREIACDYAYLVERAGLAEAQAPGAGRHG